MKFRDKMIKAMKDHAKGHIEKHAMNVEIYFRNAAGIGGEGNEDVLEEIEKELARRTYDESGDYFVTPFALEAKESLNDRHSQFGVFFPEELTEENNAPSKDIVSIKVGPGKAYVKGYEVETYGAKFVDSKKSVNDLKHKSTIGLKEGVQKTVEWMKNYYDIKN